MRFLRQRKKGLENKFLLNIRGKYLDADYERAQLGVVQKQIISRILKLSISSYFVQNRADVR